jgi:hypothetical protein
VVAYIRALENFNPKRNGRKCPKEINTNTVLANAAMFMDENLGVVLGHVLFKRTHLKGNCNWVLVKGKGAPPKPNKKELKREWGEGGISTIRWSCRYSSVSERVM